MIRIKFKSRGVSRTLLYVIGMAENVNAAGLLDGLEISTTVKKFAEHFFRSNALHCTATAVWPGSSFLRSALQFYDRLAWPGAGDHAVKSAIAQALMCKRFPRKDFRVLGISPKDPSWKRYEYYHHVWGPTQHDALHELEKDRGCKMSRTMMPFSKRDLGCGCTYRVTIPKDPFGTPVASSYKCYQTARLRVQHYEGPHVLGSLVDFNT